MGSFNPANPAELIRMFWSFAIIWSVCEFGERVTQQFDALAQELFQFKWYLYPIEIQRMLLIFMAGVQQSALIRSYGGIPCTRESFGKVQKMLEK